MRINTTSIISSLCFITGLVACKNQTDKSEAVTFSNYVDSINKIEHVYTSENWESIHNDYKRRVELIELQSAQMAADDKAKLEESKAKFALLKADYEAHIAKTEKAADLDSKTALRNRLFGEGVITQDLKFAFVNSSNALSTYETFVNTVNDNKDSYSREDWDEIKVLYEALDTRKNEIENELSGSDNVKISRLKVKFASINTTNRSGAKANENADAKDNN